MKKLLLSIFCLLLTTVAFAQMDGNYNYTIGLRGYSSLQLPKILNQTNANDYIDAYANGLLIKFNDNQLSYRISGNYLRKDISFANQCETCEIANGKVTDYSFKIGFEKNINYARVQPYFGADLGFRSNNFTGEIENANPLTVRTPYTLDTDKNGFVIAPLIGLKFNPVKQISIFAETSMDFFYSYERQETIQHDPANTRTFAKYNKWEFLLNPVSVGIQIHLVSKD